MENLCMRDVVNIDLNKGLSRTYAGMVLATGDKMANCFGAALYRGGDAVDITGYAVTGYFIRKGNAETVLIEGKANGNEAIVELPQACYTSDGSFSLAIKVSGADVTATVRVVDGAIRLTQTGTLIDPGDVVPSLDELFAKIEEMESVTAEGKATIATIKVDTAAAIKTANEATAAANTATVELAKTAGVPVVLTKTGSIVTITDGAERPAVSLVCHIEPVQEGGGDPSPDNVRPISGWDKARTWGCGVNMLDMDALVQGDVDGSSASLRVSLPLASRPLVLAGNTYTIAFSPADNQDRLWALTTDAAGAVLEIFQNGGQSTSSACTFSPTMDGYFTPIYGRRNADMTGWDAIDTARIKSFKPYLKLGYQSEYTPYQGQTLTASLPETVYGGTVDWGTGVLTVTQVMLAFAGDAIVAYYPEWNAAAFKLTSGKHGKVKCSHYVDSNGSTSLDNSIFFSGLYYGRELCGIKDTRYTSQAEYAAYLDAQAAAGTPVQVVYTLAEPVTYQLTPQQLNTLKGTNNVWSDTGDTDLTYIADTQLYIDNKFSALEAALLSTGANV